MKNELPFRLIESAPGGKSPHRVLALLGNAMIAQAAYEEAVKLYPGRPISLQDRALVVAQNWREGGDPEPPQNVRS